MNSSYVLIIIDPFPQDSERVRARPPAVRVSILYCQGAGAYFQVQSFLCALLRIFRNLASLPRLRSGRRSVVTDHDFGVTTVYQEVLQVNL